MKFHVIGLLLTKSVALLVVALLIRAVLLIFGFILGVIVQLMSEIHDIADLIREKAK